MMEQNENEDYFWKYWQQHNRKSSRIVTEDWFSLDMESTWKHRQAHRSLICLLFSLNIQITAGFF